MLFKYNRQRSYKLCYLVLQDVGQKRKDGYTMDSSPHDFLAWYDAIIALMEADAAAIATAIDGPEVKRLQDAIAELKEQRGVLIRAMEQVEYK